MKNSTFLQLLEQILRVLKNSFSFQKTISKSDIFNSETKKTIYCLEVLDRSKRNFFHFFIGIVLFLCGTISWAQPIVTDGSPVDWPNFVDVPGANRVHIFDLVNISTDGGYTGGQTKDGNDFPDWKWKQGQQNDKMDIQNAGAYLSGDKLYFFADRFSNSGDAAIGIWILQNKVSPSGTGTSGSGDPFTGVHQDGDVLIVSHFVNGGSVDDRKAYRWENGALNTTPIVLDIASLYTIVNTADVAAPTSPTDWNYVPKSGVADVYPANSFFEGFIDLKIAEITLDPCTTTFLFETRESQSLSSILVDFANGQLNNVPSAPVATTGERCGSGPVSFTATGCSGEGTELKWYDAATNGNLVYTGATYNVSITGTTSYWVSCSVGGCEGPRTQVTRVVNALPTIDGVVVNVTCNGANNGSINVTASGGIGPYTYDWADVVGTIDSEDRTALAPGFYTVIVTDSKGCTASVTKEITQPSAITASAVANNPLCFGVANTGFTITASGGTGDLEYSKDNGANYVSSGVFIGLTAGTYNWVVRDENGCTKTGTVEVTIPDAITASAVANNPLCFGVANTGFTITASGGTGDLEYSKDNGANYVSSGVFTELTAGTYNWIVRDENGCTKTGTVEVTIPDAITASAVANNPLCFGIANTGFTITASGGTGDLEYSKDNGANYVSSGIFTGLTAGTYNWVVRDENGCTKTGTVEVSIPDAITASAVANNPLCFGVANTGFTITASGGTGDLEYSKDNGANYVSSGVFTELTAGTYNWVVRDENGCTKTGTVEVTIPDEITASAVANNPLCFGVANTGFTITASGGTGDLEYSKDNGANYVSSGVFTGLTAGTYNWVVRDENGCTKTGTVEVTIPDAITASAVANNPLCFGVANTGFTITASGGTGDLEYSKDNGANYVSSGVFTELTAGTYNWVVRDENGCTKTGTVEVTIPDAITASAVANNPLCFGVANTGFTITASGGTGDLEYSKDNGANYVSSGVFTELTAGTYNWIVRDENGCTKTGTVEVTIPDAITASAVANNPLCFGVANTGFTITASGGTGDLEYSKDNGANYVSSGVFTGLTAGTYNWVVRDENGCTKTGTVEVTIPDAITASAVANNPLCFGIANTGFTITASGGTGDLEYSKDNGANYVSSGVFTELTAGTYNWVVRDENGCTKTGTVEVIIPVVVELSLTSQPETCEGTDSGSIEATFSGGTGVYRVSIDGGTLTEQTSPYTFSNLSSGLHTVLVKDFNDCELSKEINVGLILCELNCTYTQGYYGNEGGISCANNESHTTRELIEMALDTYPSDVMRIGSLGRSVVVSKTEIDITAVIKVLPGGGNSKALMSGNYSISDLPPNYLKKGVINNSLLAQTITLGLNLGISEQLGNFALQAGELATAAPEGGCGSTIPLVRECNPDGSVNNDYGYFDIKSSVVNALSDKTVRGLFDLANKALAGESVGVSLADLTYVVDKINNAFDGCRIFIGYNVGRLSCPVLTNTILTTSKVATTTTTTKTVAPDVKTSEVTTEKAGFSAYPVPFRDVLTLRYNFNYMSSVKIEVFNSRGILVFSKIDPDGYLNKEISLNLNVNKGSSQVYVVKLTTNQGSTVKKVLSSK